MLDSLTLKDILDLGTSGMLIVFLGLLWQRLNKVTDILIENGKQASAERQVIAQLVGLTPKELQADAHQVRSRQGADRAGQSH